MSYRDFEKQIVLEVTRDAKYLEGLTTVNKYLSEGFVFISVTNKITLGSTDISYYLLGKYKTESE